jgi:lysozyme
VFIKATEGIWLEDPLFDDFWTAATTLPIYKGAYHYFYPQKNIKQQINNFKSSVTLKPGDLPPVIDIEETGKLSKKEIVKNLKLFADGLKAHYGVRPIIYSNADFINDYLSEDFEEYIFWIAHYYVPKPVVSGKVKWLFWQHADKGVIHGCRELVDVNVFNGSRKDFKNILIK